MLTLNLQRLIIRVYKLKLRSCKGGVNVTNTLELEVAIKRAGLSKKEVAEHLGLSTMSLHQKINNVREFKASEIAMLYSLLNLNSLEEQQRIFFN